MWIEMVNAILALWKEDSTRQRQPTKLRMQGSMNFPKNRSAVFRSQCSTSNYNRTNIREGERNCNYTDVDLPAEKGQNFG